MDRDRENLAALRATWLASQRQSVGARERQARLSERIAGGAELLPYVLADSCSDPRDRMVDDDPRLLRVQASWDGFSLHRAVRSSPLPDAYEPAPLRPRTLVLLMLVVAVLYFVLHVAWQYAFFR